MNGTLYSALLGFGIVCLAAYYVARTTWLEERLMHYVRSFPNHFAIGDEDTNSAIRLAVVGDSYARGVGARVLEGTLGHSLGSLLSEEKGISVAVTVDGRSGITLRHTVQHQLPLIEATDYLFISMGENDVLWGISPFRYAADLQALKKELKRFGDAQVMLTTTSNLLYVPSLPLWLRRIIDYRCRRQNHQLAKAFKGVKNVHIIPIYSEGYLDAISNPELLAIDHFHPSAAGYRFWAELAVRTIHNAAV